MKDILKKWWIWLIVVIIVVIIIVAFLQLKNKDEGIGTAGISKKEFDKIEVGMSQFEVEGIIDELDEWNNDEVYEKSCEKIGESYKDHVYTYKYKYYGERSGYAIITYEADYTKTTFGVMPKVTKKEIFDVK